MKKSEAEPLIRSLVHQWRRDSGNSTTPTSKLHASDFITWLRARHPQLLEFRSTMGPTEDVERWFDQEMKLTWQN